MLIKAVLFLATLATLLEYSQANLIQDLIERAIDRENAAEFLSDKREEDAEKRMLFGLYTAKEQRREVVENYEEKCERKMLSKLKSWDSNKPRWCPPLTDWDMWNDVSKGDNTTPKPNGKSIFGK